MGLQDVQTIEDDRDNLTLLEMSPVEPSILTVVMPDQNLMSNMNIMSSELLSSDMVTDTGDHVVEQHLPHNIMQERRPAEVMPKKKAVVRRPRNKKEVEFVAPFPQEPDANGQNLLACAVCNKNFVSISRLKSHEKTHTKSRPFSCMDCGKTFTVRYSLICHTRVHTRERPYNCGTCGARFSQASSLKTHQIYKHTKDFPYLCKICNRGFISPGQRHEHVVRTHAKNGIKNSAPGKRKRKSAKQTKKEESIVPKIDNTVSFVINGSNDQEVQTNLSLPPVY